MSGGHELERFTSHSEDPASAEWVSSLGAEFGRAAGGLLAMGHAVRVSAVGYGRALRLQVTDSRGWTAGWTVGGYEELQGLLAGLCAPGAW